MKRFIKIASLVLVIGMTLAMLTACGGGGGGGGNTGGSTGGSSAGGGSGTGSGTGGSGSSAGGDSGGGSTDEPDAEEGVPIQWENSLLSGVYSGNSNIKQRKFTGTDTRTGKQFKVMDGTEGSKRVVYLSGSNGTYIASPNSKNVPEIWKIDEDNKYTVVDQDEGWPDSYEALYSLCLGPDKNKNTTVTTKWETYKNTKYYTEHAVIFDSTGAIECVYFYQTNNRADIKLVKLRQGTGNWVYLENMDAREGTVDISNTTSQNIFDSAERQLMNPENYEPKENGGTSGDKPEETEKEVSWADSRLGNIYSAVDRSNMKFYGTNSNTGKQEIFLEGRNNSLGKWVAYWDVDAGRYLESINSRMDESSREFWKIDSQNKYVSWKDDKSAFAEVDKLWPIYGLAEGPEKSDNTTVKQSKETYNGIEYYTEKAKVDFDSVGLVDCTYYYTSDVAANLSDIKMIKVEESGQKPYYLTDLTIKMSSAGIDATIGNIFTAQERKWLDPSTYTPVGESSSDEKEDVTTEKEIPWSQSRTSKVYYTDNPRNGGAKSIKLYGTDSRTGKREEYAWVTNPEVRKVIEYYSDKSEAYMWQMDWSTQEVQEWDLAGNTYTLNDGYIPDVFWTMEFLSTGPTQAENASVVSAVRIYKNQKYYTETTNVMSGKRQAICTYYYPVDGANMMTINVIKVELNGKAPYYLTDVDARISTEYVNSERSIFTREQQETLDPRNYTEAKE